MTVYVDNMEAPYRGMIMCHMLADSTEELLDMADRIGVARKWLQGAGSHREHFDICKTKRALAVKAGAVELDRRGLYALIRGRNPAVLARIQEETDAHDAE